MRPGKENIKDITSCNRVNKQDFVLCHHRRKEFYDVKRVDRIAKYESNFGPLHNNVLIDASEMK